MGLCVIVLKVLADNNLLTSDDYSDIILLLWLFVCLQCSAIGASFCYLLSYLVGRRIVWRYIPERAIEWSTHVNISYPLFLHILGGA